MLLERTNSLLAVGLFVACAALAPRFAPAASGSFAATVGEKPVKCDVWVPDDVAPVRGMAVCYGSGANQNAARSLGMGLLMETGRDADWRNGTVEQVQAMLDGAAATVKRPEIANAPIAMMGFSTGGSNSVRLMNLVPARTIAYVCLASRQVAPAAGAPQLRVPGIWVVGGSDTAVKGGGVQPAPFFDGWRALDGQVAMAVNWGADHGQTPRGNAVRYQGDEVAWFWVSEAMRLRYPGGVPSATPGHPMTLKEVPTADGWLGGAVRWTSATLAPVGGISAFTPVATVSDYAKTTKDVAKASWLPSADAAFVYRALNSVDTLTTTAQPAAPPYNTELRFAAPAILAAFKAGQSVAVTVDSRAFGTKPASNRIARMDLYDGSRLLASATAPSSGTLWNFTYVPDTGGVHALVAVASDAEGRQTSIFRCVCVQGPFATAVAPLGTPISRLAR
jgi:hypothetical protein